MVLNMNMIGINQHSSNFKNLSVEMPNAPYSNVVVNLKQTEI